ncbi:MAG: hypothetical protein ACLFVT_04705 [Syntrophobacteria bacterium]
MALIVVLGLAADILLRRFKLPGLLGMLIVGIIVGPYVLGLMREEKEVWLEIPEHEGEPIPAIYLRFWMPVQERPWRPGTVLSGARFRTIGRLCMIRVAPCREYRQQESRRLFAPSVVQRSRSATPRLAAMAAVHGPRMSIFVRMSEQKNPHHHHVAPLV